MSKSIVASRFAIGLIVVLGATFAVSKLRERSSRAEAPIERNGNRIGVASVDDVWPGHSFNVSASDLVSTDAEILDRLRQFSTLERITDEPRLMNPPTAGACGIAIDSDVHGQRFCDVFVSDSASQVIRSGEGTYPPGSLIVKAKYPDTSRKTIELLTVMQKMNPGFSPEHGDWEYSVIDASITHVLARGKITSCIECHDAYKSTDFVTRTYLVSGRTDSKNSDSARP